MSGFQNVVYNQNKPLQSIFLDKMCSFLYPSSLCHLMLRSRIFKPSLLLWGSSVELFGFNKPVFKFVILMTKGSSY